MDFDINKLESSQAYSTKGNEYPDHSKTESQRDTSKVLNEFSYWLERNIADDALANDLLDVFECRINDMNESQFEEQYNKMFY